MWESKSILRYIANKHNLESWYPTDPQKRGIVDMTLDFCANVMAPILGPKLVYPKAGFSGPVSAEELESAEKKWAEDVMPAFEHILMRSGGPFCGGAKPNIADLAILGNLVMVYGKCPDSFVCKTESLTAYYTALKAALPKYAEAFCYIFVAKMIYFDIGLYCYYCHDYYILLLVMLLWSDLQCFNFKFKSHRKC